MEGGGVGFFQGAFRGLLRCLGLATAGERDVAPLEQETAPPPPTTYEPLTSSSTTDPLVEALTSSDDKPVVSTRDIGGEGDDLSVLSRGTTGEAHYVELVDNGKPNMALLNTRLISSGGGGKNH